MTVKAFVRDPAKMNIAHANLTIVRGDVLDSSAVDQVIVGVNAVIVTLGYKPATKTAVLAEGTSNTINAMKKNGVKHLIVMSSYPMSGSHKKHDVLEENYTRGPHRLIPIRT